jgi:hypothetical protein
VIPVRLCDVPLEVRVTAAHVAMHHVRDLVEREELFHAVSFPSERVYWVREEARPIIESWKRAA